MRVYAGPPKNKSHNIGHKESRSNGDNRFRDTNGKSDWRTQLEPGAEVRLLASPSLSFSPHCGGAIRPGSPPSSLRAGVLCLAELPYSSRADTRNAQFLRAVSKL